MDQREPQGIEILSQAPTRISFVGGGTDVSPYPETYGGAVINTTVSIYMLARLRLRQDIRVTIHANTRPEPMTYPDVSNLTFDGHLDFIKAIVQEMHNRKEGFDLYFHSSLPMRSGLGGSAAMCVGVLGAFNHLLGHKGLNNYELAEKAFKIETEVLQNAAGRQDQYAAAFGGFNKFEFNGGGNVRVNPIDISPAGRRTLDHALLLFWLGDRKPSGGIIEDQINGIDRKNQQLEAMHATKEYIPEMSEALATVDVQRIGRLLDVLWELKKRFSKYISDDRIDTIYSCLRQAGMIGGKLTGAGGGGHLLACCEIEQYDKVLAAAEQMGLRNVPFTFVREGMLSWESPVRTITQDDRTGIYLPAGPLVQPAEVHDTGGSAQAKTDE